jgi:hypothetical protein
MLLFKIFSNKSTFKKPNGDEVIDLIRRAVSFIGVKSNVGQGYLVNEDTVMRPDLIAQQFYGDSSSTDLLLKYNGYSNPFAIDINDFFRIPDSENLSKFGGTPSLANLGPRKKKANVVLAPKTKKDKRRIEYQLNRLDTSAPPVAPNVALDSGVKVLNGQIVFGSDVTSIKKENCPDPVSRSKLIESLIQNKIGT